MAISVLLIATAFFLNWSWDIYDMDDGTTLAYHLLGRNPAIQPPYSAYDSMCDRILSFFTPDYHTLFSVMVGATLVASFFMLFFLTGISASMLSASRERMGLYILLFLLAAPEIIYLSMSFKSNIIGFAFILAAHYLAIKNRALRRNSSFILSVVFFGFGAACRWNLAVYALPLFADVLMAEYQHEKKINWVRALLWGTCLIVSFVLFVYVSGYDIAQIKQVVIWGKEYTEGTDYQLIAMLAAGINMFTPAMLVGLFAGAMIIFARPRKHLRVVLFTLLSLPMFFYLGFSTNPKSLLTLFPAFVAIFATGVDTILYTSNRGRKLAGYLMIAFLAIPWCLGVQVNSDTTMWGPGFDIKTSSSGKVDFGKRLDDRMSVKDVRIVFGDGFAISAPEGVRPLWGNAYVLFGRQVQALNRKMGKEVETVISTASTKHADIYTDRGNPLLLAGLCKMKFVTADSSLQAKDIITRTFSNGIDTVIVKRPTSTGNIQNFELLDTVLSKNFVAHFTYTSQLAKFISKAPTHGFNLVGRPGAFSGVFEKNK